MARTLKLSARVNCKSIKSVTVYKRGSVQGLFGAGSAGKTSSAEIVRVFPLNLQPGNTKIEITELPSCIDTQSVRVSGLGEARLFDVVCTALAPGSKPTAAEGEAVRLLLKEKQLLESQRSVHDHESDVLVNYAKTLKGEHVPPAEMVEFLQSFVQQGRKNLEAVAEIDEKLVAVERKIEAEREKSAARKGATEGQVVIVVGADSATSVELKLTYIVANAAWDSAYELHSTTTNGKPESAVSLHYRARIVQSTGEDWTDTALTLSTVAASTVVKDIPLLRPIKIQAQARGGGLFSNNNHTGFKNQLPQASSNNMGPQALFGQRPPQQAPSGTSIFGSAGGGLFGSSQAPAQQQQQHPATGAAFGAFGGGGTTTLATAAAPADGDIEVGPSEDFEEIAIPDVQSGPTTIVSETPLAMTYAVDGNTTVPSDGTAHQVSIAILPFEAKISHICTPRIDPGCTCGATFVSKTSIGEINTGDTFTCTLGHDVSTKVTYARSSKTVTASAGSFQETMNTTTYTTKITITNKHAFKLADLLVRDVIPTCDDKRAKVILRKPDGLADSKDGELVKLQQAGLQVQWGKGSGEKDGRFEWMWSVESGASVALEAEWELRAPADVSWVEHVPLFA
ncbi:unnamed protein product [Mycena citricolor]|uniref:Mucoidy inhibitor A n=1 Tax=Mycena citricolor TaxID=2018698 RepID=A0AAD2HSV4_9AGAR|nr:unnamed protein product [Mycena citricolor]